MFSSTIHPLNKLRATFCLNRRFVAITGMFPVNSMHVFVILVSGHGKLATTIRKDLHSHLNCVVDAWENAEAYKNERNKIIVHIGSGRQLPEILRYCSAHGTPLIQGSTGLEYDRTLNDFTVIEAPNLNILLLKCMNMLKQFGKHFASYDIQITESHQAEKTSLPGTAVAFAEYFGIDPAAIQSIREPHIQLRELKIAAEYLERHAVHVITIKDGDTTINVRTEVLGLLSYVAGLAAIIQIVPKLERRFYDVVELVELNLI